MRNIGISPTARRHQPSLVLAPTHWRAEDNHCAIQLLIAQGTLKHHNIVYIMHGKIATNSTTRHPTPLAWKWHVTFSPLPECSYPQASSRSPLAPACSCTKSAARPACRDAWHSPTRSDMRAPSRDAPVLILPRRGDIVLRLLMCIWASCARKEAG